MVKLGLVIAMVLLTATARAEDRDAAVLHYNAAVQLIEAGDYAGAIREFQDAYVAAPSPSFLYNIAQAYARIGEKGDAEANRLAVQNYRRYLREYQEAKGVASPKQAEVERAIEQLEAARSEPPATAAPPAKPTVEEKPPIGERSGETELPPLKPVELPAVENAPAQSPVAQPEDKRAEQAPVVEPSPSAARPRSKARRAAGWTLVVGGALVAAAGGLVFYLGGAAANDANALSGAQGATLDDYYAKRTSSLRMQTAGPIVLGVGAAAIIAGIITLALPGEKTKTAWWLAPSGNGMAIAGRF